MNSRNTAILLLLIFHFTVAGAYTEDIGLETDDRALMDYKLWIDGVLEQEYDSIEFTISNTSLIQGFYSRVLGMKINEEKNFTVPAEEAYTDPSHQLYGKDLDFYVKLLEITYNAHVETSTETTTETTSQTTTETTTSTETGSDDTSTSDTEGTEQNSTFSPTPSSTLPDLDLPLHSLIVPSLGLMAIIWRRKTQSHLK